MQQLPVVPSETVTLALYALYGTFVTGLFGVILALINVYAQKRAEKKADIVAVKAEEVREVLADKAVVTDEKLDSIHVLVNSDMGKQKLRTAQALRRIADLTKDQADLAAALDAEEEYKKHQSRQAVVDSGGKTA